MALGFCVEMGRGEAGFSSAVWLSFIITSAEVPETTGLCGFLG